MKKNKIVKKIVFIIVLSFILGFNICTHFFRRVPLHYVIPNVQAVSRKQKPIQRYKNGAE